MYKIINRSMGAVPDTSQGLYEERVVINCSAYDVGVVDKFGRKFTVKQDTKEVGHDIKIYIRSGLGNRASDKRSLALLETIVCVVEYQTLLTNHVYIKEADLVLCNSKDLNHVSHPNLSFSYEDNFRMMYASMIDSNSIKTPTIKVVANDPSGRIKHIYMSILDTICKIEVTNYQISDNGVTIMYPSDGFSIKFIPFDIVLNSNGFVKLDKINCFIGTSVDIVRSAMDREYSDRKVYTRKEYEDLEKSLKGSFKKELSEMESNLRTKFKSEQLLSESALSVLKAKHESLTLEHESLKRVCATTNGYFEAFEKKMERETRVLENESKKMKIFLDIIKIVAPLVGGVIVGKMIGSAAVASGK